MDSVKHTRAYHSAFTVRFPLRYLCILCQYTPHPIRIQSVTQRVPAAFPIALSFLLLNPTAFFLRFPCIPSTYTVRSLYVLLFHPYLKLTLTLISPLRSPLYVSVHFYRAIRSHLALPVKSSSLYFVRVAHSATRFLGPFHRAFTV